MKIKFLIPVLLLLFSCAGTKKTQPSSAAPGTQQSSAESKPENTMTPEPGTDKDLQESKSQKAQNKLYRLVVSFYSKGEGTDEKAITNYDLFIAYYEKQHNLRISCEKTPWGREGEVDYCIELNNLDAEKQNQFLLQTREILIQSQLVHIVENAPCRHKH